MQSAEARTEQYLPPKPESTRLQFSGAAGFFKIVYICNRIGWVFVLKNNRLWR